MTRSPNILRGAVVAVAVAGFMLDAGAGASQAAIPSLVVTLSGSAVSLSRPSVPVGSLRLTVRNTSSSRRDLTIVGKSRVALVRPGRSVTISLRFTSPQTKVLRSTPVTGVRGRTLTARLVVTSPTATLKLPKVKLTLVQGKTDALTFVAGPPDDPSRLMVVHQDGLVALIKDGVPQQNPYLDLRPFVTGEGEKGLLSIAFAPDYQASRLVYAFFNNRDGNIRIFEYRGSASRPDQVDPTQRRLLLALVKPTADHNGGMLQFGPDGYLYVSIGDGGANPPEIPVGVSGQRLTDLFGSILRIDPRNENPYAIPAGNPFASLAGARPEIVAYGLRNPWRFWIDAKTNQMLIGDVGEGGREEINRLPLDKLGLNFGWPCKEGTTIPPKVAVPASCATATLTPPLLQYPHSNTRCSITGGIVARDPRLTSLNGLYLWSDFCDGTVYVTDPTAARPSESSLNAEVAKPTSFGTDAKGRIYITAATGALYRIDPA